VIREARHQSTKPSARRARTAPNRTPQSKTFKRRLPIGAELSASGGVHFRVWAPQSRHAAIQFATGPAGFAHPAELEMSAESGGYFSVLIPDAKPGTLYKIRLDSGAFPDPVSRFQPEGPHGPSQVVDPNSFRWTDDAWKGPSRHGQVIYELHIGTLTPQGTWRSAIAELPRLADLGITLLEVMPVAEFPGRFGWGYDGVDLFAPTQLYGSPDDFRAFINRAHELGLGVILDVVYNHVGPDGNYLKQFSPDYFTRRYANEWGEAINFDGDNSGPVREFFASNAQYWIDEFHLDGLRLDATQQIFDGSPMHILTEIGRAVRNAARGRKTFVVAENEAQHSRLVRETAHGGYGLDALWNDDFHHSARVALTGHNEAYYSDYRGTPQEFISAMKRGYLFQGQWYSWQKKRRGTPAFDLGPTHFVTFIENHDQVSNCMHGARLHQLSAPGCHRALTALLLLGPPTPMLFQGQEFASSAPFVYFADHNPELARLVSAGRRQFLEQFPSSAGPASAELFSAPESEETFRRCKLDLSEREKNSTAYALHRDLIRLRRTDPVFSQPERGSCDGAVLSPTAFALRFFSEKGGRLLLVNLGLDLALSPIPEPLLAAPEGCVWEMKFSTEEARYGGSGVAAMEFTERWRLPGHSAVLLAAATPPAGAQSQSHGTHPQD
jgi:maltooligosyltrehalose trehalohydrolase